MLSEMDLLQRSIDNIMKYKTKIKVEKVLLTDVSHIYVRRNENCLIYKQYNRCGAYVLISDIGKRYIGSSINVINRINSHNIKYLVNIKAVILFLTDDYKTAYSLEQQMIVDIEPELNIIYPKDNQFCRCGENYHDEEFEDDIIVGTIYASNVDIKHIKDGWSKNT